MDDFTAVFAASMVVMFLIFALTVYSFVKLKKIEKMLK
ncbi:hypothetical protein Ferp_0958 [Ferroglobus placidus DSM 10642]|uniref:Uncharacterized protein n=1 Tax=Ferroglobus placidus (strain DSM 10642 / AEDII12DO) TaxID=589924 RepID=D3RXA9_FERPA|nr:hypothetical protein Ferp_0958 [Ferroglobus placidus DSM 10642]